MKRFLVLALGVFMMSGCLARTYVADQNGTNGYQLNQTPNEGRVFKFGKAKKIAVVEVELGEHKLKEIGKTDSYSQDTQDSSVSDTASESTDTYSGPTTSTEAVDSGKDVSYTEYTIAKNDTLQKVSQKFYGTTKKWMKIYNENKDVLSSPDKIYPGLVIKVPNKE